MTHYFPTSAEIRESYVRDNLRWRAWDESVYEAEPRLARQYDDWIRGVERAAAVKVLRDMASRVRADFAEAGMRCGWVGALDDEATRLEQS